MAKKAVHVAIGLIQHQHQLLIGWRDEKLHQGGCYEFPGGKIEHGETAQEAVKREIFEEVGVTVEVTQLFEKKYFDYGDKEVFLEFLLCAIKDDDLAKITKPWQWVPLYELHNYIFPAANQSIIERLNWSQTLAITANHTDLKESKPKANLCYLRKYYENAEHIQQDLMLLENYQIKAILNVSYFEQLSVDWQNKIFAIHLTQQQLSEKKWSEIYPQHNFITACHHPDEIQKANEKNCHAVLISPVQSTATHPDQSALGWQTLEGWCKQTSLPVYALGGIQLNDLTLAQQHGAYGIAGIRAFF